MCLSPEVDLVAGTAIGLIAIQTIRETHVRQLAPIACVPALFSIHSFASALMWLASQGHVSQSIGDIATAIYLVIAFIVLPILVPISVLTITASKSRRRLLQILLAAGLVTGIDYALNILNGHSEVKACHNYLDVRVTSTLAISSILYGIATCAVMLISEYRPLRMWGIVNVVFVAILYVRLQEGLASLWCLWAASTSFFVLWLVRELNREHKATGKWAWEEQR